MLLLKLFVEVKDKMLRDFKVISLVFKKIFSMGGIKLCSESNVTLRYSFVKC